MQSIISTEKQLNPQGSLVAPSVRGTLLVRPQHRVVVTAVPLRLSFAGGGTDFPAYYLREGGAVLGTTIDKFVYVTVKAHGDLFGSKFRLSYSETENVDSLDEIRNDIMRECMRLLPSTVQSTSVRYPICRNRAGWVRRARLRLDYCKRCTSCAASIIPSRNSLRKPLT